MTYDPRMYGAMQPLKVLVIFPDPAKGIAQRRIDLGLPPLEVKQLQFGIDEVVELVNRLDGTLCAGRKATLSGLLDYFEESWDIVWIITHGEEAGWYLSDGLVNASEMIGMIRACGAWLTVMNTCSSEDVARKAATELGTAFLATITEVPDRQAFITGVLFVQKLAAGYDYVEAWESVKPGQAHPYLLIEGRGQMPPNANERLRSRNPDEDTLQKFIASVQELDLILNGSERLGVPGVKAVVKEIKEELAVIRLQLDAIQRRQQIRNWIMTATLIVLAAVVVSIVAISNTGGL